MMIIFESIGYVSIVVALAIIGLVAYVGYNVIIKKQRPNNYYTPYDYITCQTDKEFHDEKLEVETEDDHDKNKCSERKTSNFTYFYITFLSLLIRHAIYAWLHQVQPS